MDTLSKTRKAVQLLKSSITKEQYHEFCSIVSELNLTVQDVIETTVKTFIEQTKNEYGGNVIEKLKEKYSNI